MREIKFRAWDNLHKRMVPLDFVKCSHNELKHEEYDNRFTPMQYTGLNDKNGKEIYESDIVEFWFKYSSPKKLISTVEFYNYAWRLNRLWLFTEIHEVEVIGNIYENYDLIKTNNK